MPAVYRVYGLDMISDLILPELVPADPACPAPADQVVTLCLGAVPAQGLATGKQLGPHLWVGPDQFWLNIPDVARFLVTGGHSITIDPAPGIDEDSIRVFLLGSAMGALLFQRGHLVLHGNAVEVDGHCMVCVGNSGVGKSTLAAGFAQRGFPVLADDVVAVDADCAAIPGFARIKLWQDAAQQLGVTTDGLRRIRPMMEKFNLPLGPQAATPDRAVPIRWVYVLGVDNAADDFRLAPVRGMAKFPPLRNNTYRQRYMEGMALAPEHLRRCGALAGQIHLARMTRPGRGFDLDGLIDHLLADMRANP